MATARKTKNKMRGELGGFTIIEVVLVLAIAGLIFLMVFIALPNLQRSQRDTQRRSDLARLQDQLVQYQTNNKGKLPDPSKGGTLTALDGDTTMPTCGTNTEAACFVVNYMNAAGATENEFVDPDGWRYGVTFQTLTSGTDGLPKDFKDHMIMVYLHAKCDREKAVYSGAARDFAVVYRLEGNGVYCRQNS